MSGLTPAIEGVDIRSAGFDASCYRRGEVGGWKIYEVTFLPVWFGEKDREYTGAFLSSDDLVASIAARGE